MKLWKFPKNLNILKYSVGEPAVTTFYWSKYCY